MPDSDFDLIQGCVNSERKSQELLYQKYATQMYAICISYSKDRDDAKDILQEGFIKIFSNIKNYVDRGNSVESWIRRIIVNTAIDYYRRSIKKQKIMMPLDSIYEDAFIAEASVLEKLGASDILILVNKLPNCARVIFNLYILEGYTHKEIAEMLEITEGCSKSQLSRAKQLLRNWLGSTQEPTYNLILETRS